MSHENNCTLSEELMVEDQFHLQKNAMAHVPRQAMRVEVVTNFRGLFTTLMHLGTKEESQDNTKGLGELKE